MSSPPVSPRDTSVPGAAAEVEAAFAEADLANAAVYAEHDADGGGGDTDIDRWSSSSDGLEDGEIDEDEQYDGEAYSNDVHYYIDGDTSSDEQSQDSRMARVMADSPQPSSFEVIPYKLPPVAFTCTSALPKCEYKEEFDKPERFSDEYLAATLRVLDFLTTHAADELTPTQAHFFTTNAGTPPYGPSATIVVQLCYFMRSHGFDVYAKFPSVSANTLRLYIADPETTDRTKDKLYWEQDLKTGSIAGLERIFIPPAPTGFSSSSSHSSIGPPHTISRRGAVPDIWSDPMHADSWPELPAVEM